MSQQGVNVWTQLPIKNSLYSANDRMFILFGVDTANTTNSVAQTATISTTNLINEFKAFGLVGNNNIQQITVTVNSAALLASNVTPITIIPAAGANTVILPFLIQGFSGNGTNYTNQTQTYIGYPTVGPSTDFGGGAISGLMTANNSVLQEDSSTGNYGLNTQLRNIPIQIWSNNGNPANGTFAITLTVFYNVLTGV